MAYFLKDRKKLAEIKKLIPAKSIIKKYLNNTKDESIKFWQTQKREVMFYIAYKLFNLTKFHLNMNRETLIKLLTDKSSRQRIIGIKSYTEEFCDTGAEKGKIAQSINEKIEKKYLFKKGESGNPAGRPTPTKMTGREAAKKNIPIRICNSKCEMTANCELYTKGKVKPGDICIYDYAMIDKWINAFEKKQIDEMSKEAGLIMGIMQLNIMDMAKQVRKDGVVIEKIRTDNLGRTIINQKTKQPMTEKIAHPLISEINKIVQTMKISLPEFLMTPKSKGEQNILQGFIKDTDKISIKEMKEMQMLSHKQLIEAFDKSVKMRKEFHQEDEKEEDNLMNFKSDIESSINRLPAEMQTGLLN